MQRHVARVVHPSPVRQQDADMQPVGGWDKCRYRLRGARRVEQPGDVGARRNDPTRSPSDRSCGPDPQETVADREARLNAALAERIVALRVKHPSGIGGRLQRVLHRSWPYHVGRRLSRPATSSSIATSSKLVTTRSAPAARSEAASPSRATPRAAMRPARAASMPAGASSTTKH